MLSRRWGVVRVKVKLELSDAPKRAKLVAICTRRASAPTIARPSASSHQTFLASPGAENPGEKKKKKKAISK